MNLHLLTDDTLDQKVGSLIRSEREILSDILHHLREVEKRRLYSKYHYSSLFDYAVKRHRYSEDQAARRISAMRLLCEVPEIENKVVEGKLTLTHLNQARTLFRKEKELKLERSTQEKIEVLKKLESTTKREAEKIIEAEARLIEPLVEMPKLTEMSFLAPESLQEKISKLLNLRSHVKGQLKLEELLEDICDLALSKWDPVEKAKRVTAKPTQLPTSAAEVKNTRSPLTESQKTQSPAPARANHVDASNLEKASFSTCSLSEQISNVSADKVKNISLVSYSPSEEVGHITINKIQKVSLPTLSPLERINNLKVHQREKATSVSYSQSVQASHINVQKKNTNKTKTTTQISNATKQIARSSQPTSSVSRYIPSAYRHHVYLRDQGRCVNCGSRSLIQIDHVVPLLKGGSHDPSNLRLLCRACNQRHAIHTYGQTKMGKYLRAPQTFYWA